MSLSVAVETNLVREELEEFVRNLAFGYASSWSVPRKEVENRIDEISANVIEQTVSHLKERYAIFWNPSRKVVGFMLSPEIEKHELNDLIDEGQAFYLSLEEDGHHLHTERTEDSKHVDDLGAYAEEIIQEALKTSVFVAVGTLHLLRS